MDKCIVYIGDFDFRNENVQAHLVRNNGKMLNFLGYHMEYIGINRKITSFKEVSLAPECRTSNYLELPDTLNAVGALKIGKIINIIIKELNKLKKIYTICGIITYQSPTYAFAISTIAKWCKKNRVSYIVNCADIPTFELQPFIRRIVMKANWHYLHKTNQKRADGVIAVSKFIADYYGKPNRSIAVIPPTFDLSGAGVSENKISSDNTVRFIYAGIPFKVTGREATPEGMKDRLDKIIDMFIRLSTDGVEFNFDIFGISKEDYLSGVPRHAVALVGENKIRFGGRLNHAETLQMVARADFSINYRDENLETKAGFSTKVVESVSVGTPVIINSISDTFFYLKDGSDGFMLSGDIEKDIEKLKMLCLMTQEERSVLKRNLYEKKIFDVTKYKDTMDYFLSSLVIPKGNGENDNRIC